MKIIIVGAGIGGTSAGIALQKLGHEVVIYDQMQENKPVGAALSLWSNGVKVLNWLGLADEVKALGGSMDDMAYVDGLTGETMCQFSLAPVTEQTGQKPYPVARADLQALLMERFGLDKVHLGMRMVGIEDDGETVTVTFADGSTATADMLIGADGARSITRDYVAPEGAPPIEREYSGYTNFNGLIPVDEAIGPQNQWTSYVAEGKRACVMPVAGDRFYFWFDVVQPSGLPYDRSEGKAPLEDSIFLVTPNLSEGLNVVVVDRLANLCSRSGPCCLPDAFRRLDLLVDFDLVGKIAVGKARRTGKRLRR